MKIADPIKLLSAHFCKFPGIGERTAMRLILHILQTDKESIHSFAHALSDVANRVRECAACCMLTVDGDMCSVCLSSGRDKTLLCIVANIQDLMAIETTDDFRGLYHVLHGTLAPINGIGPQELRFEQLIKRFESPSLLQEVIIATPPTVEGEATALYVREQLKDKVARVSRIASGVPVGGDLQFADRLTLARALRLRQEIL